MSTSVDAFAVHSTERLDGPSEYLIRKAVCIMLDPPDPGQVTSIDADTDTETI